MINGPVRIRFRQVIHLTHVWMTLAGRPQISRVHITADLGRRMTGPRIKSSIRRHWPSHVLLPSVILVDEESGGGCDLLKGTCTVEDRRTRGEAHLQGYSARPITGLPAHAHTYIVFRDGLCHVADLYLTENPSSPFKYLHPGTERGTVRSFRLNVDRYVELTREVIHE